jgi:hypothetical protein
MFELLGSTELGDDPLMASEVLTPDEIDSYWANGYAFVENSLTPEQLEALVADFDSWIEESCLTGRGIQCVSRSDAQQPGPR